MRYEILSNKDHAPRVPSELTLIMMTKIRAQIETPRCLNGLAGFMILLFCQIQLIADVGIERTEEERTLKRVARRVCLAGGEVPDPEGRRWPKDFEPKSV